jgi:hypothetical protein
MKTLVIVALLALLPRQAAAETKVERHFEDTDHVLTIYHITGKEPGATMMMIGGIQGDEPGGYLAADLYADMLLERGNLIVVPRANFFSIKRQQRGVNGDMNRKFADGDSEQGDYDARIVEIIKQHMANCDVLLNLHEGSGYYSPEYVSDMRNPLRYGQSIIIDTASYRRPDSSLVDLETPAKHVIAEINENIKNPEHYFTLSNHDTFSDNTDHTEQRGSATYNALALFGIPAYGIETSKSIESNVTKVKYQTLLINAFMREFGIIPEHPSVYLPIPELEHLVITMRDSDISLAVENGSTLTITPSSVITVASVVANYKRGITVDIVGHGNSNDLGRPTLITKPTVIKVYKDAYLCGSVPVGVSRSGPVATTSARKMPDVRLESVEFLVCNTRLVTATEDTLHVVRGDNITITEARASDPMDVDFRVNFYGFVGNPDYNDAEDRGYVIDTARDLMPRFSLNGDGRSYRIEVLKNSTVIGSVYVALVEPSVRYLIVRLPDGETRAVTTGQSIACPESGNVTLLDIISNIDNDPPITATLILPDGTAESLTPPVAIPITARGTLRLSRGPITLGSVTLEK